MCLRAFVAILITFEPTDFHKTQYGCHSVGDYQTVYNLYISHFSIDSYKASKGRMMIVNDDLGKIWKETVIASLWHNSRIFVESLMKS